MKILGINFSNDAAASLVIDGQVIAACQEERFSRVKHDASFPMRALRFCLDRGGIGMNDLDAVGFFWNPGIHAEGVSSRWISVPRDHLEYLYSLPAHLLRATSGNEVQRVDQTFHMQGGRALRMHYLTHHDCHMAACFYRSNYPSAAVLTVDGYGERASTQIARASAKGFEVLKTIEFPHSIGSLYACLTEFLGFRANSGEGKVMGLASYGQPTYYDAMSKMFELTKDGFELDLSYFSYFLSRRNRFAPKLVEVLGPPRVPESELTQRHMDIAASLQKVTEELLLHVGKLSAQLTGEKRLCLAGGVAL
ncbi:MAG TPA: carbamoyltransferase N-terminal domain-containing protein, partial [Polyangiaceae bacterium]|nr:carbamoyltransferase N-terminal domain-containing protein [Polyangiaceae bacterium]